MQRILELEADSAKTHRGEREGMGLAIMPLLLSLHSVRSRPHFSAVYFYCSSILVLQYCLFRAFYF